MTYPDPRQQPPTGPIRPQPPGFHPPTSGFPAPPPFPPPPPGPPKKKGLSAGAIVGIVLGSVVALCCVVGVIFAAVSDPPKKNTADEQPAPAASNAAGSGAPASGAPASAATTPAKPAKTSDVAAAGTAVRDGKFEFKVVKGPECGKKQIGNEKAQGHYCTITLNIKNIGNDARTFDDSNVIAYSADGARFETDGVAGMYANPDGETFLEKINPGNQVTAIIVFDVATTVKLTTLEVHDSMFSRGAKVALA
ncbi:DUF4352 domain-containing protein [Dactylosporangium sucinum]|uniref:Mpr protein n=1 Tax=Dactylosporangium sucinum TaxID=1424081 RepID=A0A917X245_9ACTN|nr:DUF4352 domain-containing protein [Dactylosporangium sucinum]GGM53172.1 Mpr protein [Dactylosporangium sucinum]